MTRRFWKKEARKHAEDESAYKRADRFSAHLGEKEDEKGPQFYEEEVRDGEIDPTEHGSRF